MGKHKEASEALNEHAEIRNSTYPAGIRVREDEENTPPHRP